MDKIYLDNSSTSFPKAPGVGEEMKNYIENIGCNISRGGYNTAYNLEERILETRELVSNYFSFGNIRNVCFTPSVTYALNYVILGLLKDGDHVIISSLEHNAVARPLNGLKNVDVTILNVDSEGYIDIDDLDKAFKNNTKLVLINHASNVFGTVQDARAIGEICKKHNVPFVLDASQSAGVIDIDFKDFNLSALCAPAHKGLLGPQGLGLLLLTDSFNELIRPTISGGTGSVSDLLFMPDFLPDKFEPGTLNLPGIIGLNSSIKYLNDVGRTKIREHELNLVKRFMDGIKNFDHIRVIGPKGIEGRVGVCSIDFLNMDNSDAAYILDNDYGIMTRCGLHCAPLAHKAMGTFPKGTVRFSFGYFNTESDVDKAIRAIEKLK